MSRTVTIAQRVRELQRLQANMPRVLTKAAKQATMKAVEVAADNTPPKAGTGRGGYIGKNMLTGELKAAWAKDSVVEPMGGALSGGDTFVTILGNNQEYVSYVENGHVLNKHFVPGLYIDDNGLLSRNTDGSGGLVVGTKTRWIKGEFMADKGKAAYHRAIVDLLDREIRRLAD